MSFSRRQRPPAGSRRSSPPARQGGLATEAAYESYLESKGSSRPETGRRGHSLPGSYHLLWAVTLALLVFGLVMVFSASSVVGLFRENPNRYHFLRQQGLLAAAGLVALVALSRLDYRRWRLWILAFTMFTVGFLLLVKLPGAGRGANGATRWIDLGFVSLQPSELAKLAVVGLGAHLLSLQRARKRDSRILLWPFGGVVLLTVGLILLQPDLGTALLVCFIAMGLLWVAGLRVDHWLALAAAGTGLGLLLIMSADYRRERFFAFLDPFADPQDSGFQVIQSLLAFGSGGWLGVGPGRSVQKFSYLPEAHTDMIFAIVGEELGLLGVGAVILLFGLFILAAWRLARRCVDPFGKYLITGCMLLVGGQAAVNIGGVLGALPLTGVPLPFISFGRTNLLVVLVTVGVISSVARFGPVSASELGAGVATGTHPVDPPSPGSPDPISLLPGGKPRRVHASPEMSNVAYLDSRRRHRRSRRPRPRPR